MEQSHGFTRITWYSLERTLQFFNWCRCRLPGEGGVEKGNKKCGKPSTSTPKRTSSAQAPSSCQPTPGPQYWRRTDAVKIRGNKTMVIAGNKLSTYIVALVLGPKQGPASLLHLLGHSHHARCNIPEQWTYKGCWTSKGCGKVSSLCNKNLLGLAVLAGDNQHHPGGLTGEPLPQLHTLNIQSWSDTG